MTQVVGLSVNSVWPLVWGKNGPKTLQRILSETGLETVSLAPFRRWRMCDLDMFPASNVLSYEVVSGHMTSTVRGREREKENGSKSSPLSGVVDWFLYGNKARLIGSLREFRDRFPSALGVDAGASSLLKTVPANGVLESVYLNYSQGIVFDTLGARKILPDFGGKAYPVGFLNDLISRNRVRVVHFRADTRKELMEFVRGDSEAGDGLLYDLMKVSLLNEIPVMIDLPWSLLLPDPVACIQDVADSIIRHTS